jgi:hypothetical protein
MRDEALLAFADFSSSLSTKDLQENREVKAKIIRVFSSKFLIIFGWGLIGCSFPSKARDLSPSFYRGVTKIK